MESEILFFHFMVYTLLFFIILEIDRIETKVEKILKKLGEGYKWKMK